MVLAILSDRHVKRVFDFFGERLKCSTERDHEESYEAIPHHFYTLHKCFSSIVDHAVDTVRTWFVAGDSLFQFTGGRMLSSSFPDFPGAFEQMLRAYIDRNNREDVEFVVRVLSSYRGQSFLYETCKAIVRTLAPDDSLLSNVQIILESTDVLSGEFGLVEAYKQKREALLPWLSDADPKVKAFAEQYIGGLDRQIAAEQRRSEEDLEMRKRMYDKPEGDADKS